MVRTQFAGLAGLWPDLSTGVDIDSSRAKRLSAESPQVGPCLKVASTWSGPLVGYAAFHGGIFQFTGMPAGMRAWPTEGPLHGMWHSWLGQRLKGTRKAV